MTQLELFADEIAHVHVFEITQGPYIKNASLGVWPDSRWCWTCGSWTNRVGGSQDEAWKATTEELAMRYACMVKAGEIDRHDAYRFMQSSKWNKNFSESVLAIDIAIGELNAGKGN